jgi:hypothetical protein
LSTPLTPLISFTPPAFISIFRRQLDCHFIDYFDADISLLRHTPFHYWLLLHYAIDYAIISLFCHAIIDYFITPLLHCHYCSDYAAMITPLSAFIDIHWLMPHWCHIDAIASMPFIFTPLADYFHYLIHYWYWY